MAEFNSADLGYDDLKDIDPPLCFSYVFNIYLELYNLCKDSISWIDIDSYMRVRGVKLQQYEIDYILKINKWANSSVYELKSNED